MSELTAWMLIIGCGLIWFFSVRHILAQTHRTSTKTDEAEQTESSGTTPNEKASPQEWYEILGVAPEASVDEIRACYTRLMKLYHPDRVHGLAPEYERISQAKSKDLNRAYAQAMRSKKEQTRRSK